MVCTHQNLWWWISWFQITKFSILVPFQMEAKITLQGHFWVGLNILENGTHARFINSPMWYIHVSKFHIGITLALKGGIQMLITRITGSCDTRNSWTTTYHSLLGLGDNTVWNAQTHRQIHNTSVFLSVCVCVCAYECKRVSYRYRKREREI